MVTRKVVKKIPVDDGVNTSKKSEATTTVRDENLVNAPVEGVKTKDVTAAKETKSPIDDPQSVHYIRPADENASGASQHAVRASRGEEVGHYQMPQSGVFNNTNLKA